MLLINTVHNTTFPVRTSGRGRRSGNENNVEISQIKTESVSQFSIFNRELAIRIIIIKISYGTTSFILVTLLHTFQQTFNLKTLNISHSNRTYYNSFFIR